MSDAPFVTKGERLASARVEELRRKSEIETKAAQVRLDAEVAAATKIAELNAPRGKGDVPPFSRSSDPIPVVLERLRDGITREAEALLNGSVGLDTADRVKVMLAAAKLTGFIDAPSTGPTPFVLRGFTPCDEVLPAHVETVTCASCGHTRAVETTPAVADPKP